MKTFFPPFFFVPFGVARNNVSPCNIEVSGRSGVERSDARVDMQRARDEREQNEKINLMQFRASPSRSLLPLVWRVMLGSV
jgi:hypothetical protein